MVTNVPCLLPRPLLAMAAVVGNRVSRVRQFERLTRTRHDKNLVNLLFSTHNIIFLLDFGSNLSSKTRKASQAKVSTAKANWAKISQALPLEPVDSDGNVRINCLSTVHVIECFTC